MAHLATNSVLARLKAPVQTWLVTAVVFAYGLGLTIQSPRWHATPAYGILLRIFSADAWGIVHLAATALMIVGIITPPRWTSIVAHTATIVLLGIWDFAFFVRWDTDGATTSVNPTNWTALLILACWSAMLIDRPRV